MKKSVLAIGLIMFASASAHAASEQSSCGGYSTIEMKECASEKFDAADAKLNAAYKQLLAAAQQRDKEGVQYGQAPNEVTNRLKAAQRAWIPFRDANCNLASIDMLGGTGEGLSYMSCLIDMTEKRTQELLDLKKNDL